MSPRRTAPYGTWTSPISADLLARAGRALGSPTFVGEEVWWSEGRPTEGGRTTVVAGSPGGAVRELLPPPWNARTRVHEYGGGAWLAVPGTTEQATDTGPQLVFAHFADQRLYRLQPGAGGPVPLTPEPPSPAALRYADLSLAPGGREVWCVRERHAGGGVTRHLVAVPLDGRAATDPSAVREIVGGSTFLAHPRPSPDGTRVAWVAWDHPNMPWDGTQLRVGRLDADGRVPAWSAVLGGPRESVLQPEWVDDEQLYAVSDRTGWWNLYRVAAAGGSPAPLHPAEEEFGLPLWQLGMGTYAVLGDGRLACVHGAGTKRLGVLDPATGSLTDLDLPYSAYGPHVAAAGTRVAVAGYSASEPSQVVQVDVATGATEVVRRGMDRDAVPDPAYLPVPESTTLPGPGGRDVHVHVYRPRNPDFEAPEGERPPYVVFVHGGPTSQSLAAYDLSKAYLTSRGIGVVDVNYGGSSGYGRAYRERLRGQWGVVDVEDCAAAARALAERGDADPRRLAIRGGSAGGWTTLCAVTRTDTFAAGCSLFGVADARLLAETTHDFESRYLDGLIGPLPETQAVWDERSPLTHAAEARCPVLLLQGDEDAIVPLEQAEKFRAALAARGIPHAIAVYAGEQHGFRKAESIVSATEAELSFYGQVLGFEPPGVPRVELTS